MNEDAELLRSYAKTGSEADFAEFVRRHINFVYSAALRRVNGDAHLAQDVTQSVFTDLARKAATVANNGVLAGWLFTSTRFAAAKAVRAEQRWHAREKEAQAMQDMLHDKDVVSDWTPLRSQLDTMLDALSRTDREAILLRFFEGRGYADVGARLGVSDNTARMRVDRAIEKLRGLFEGHGLHSTHAAVGALLAAEAATAAPAGLAAAVAGSALASGASLAGGSSFLAFMSMSKLQVSIVAAIGMVGTAGYVMQAHNDATLRRELDQLQRPASEIEALRQENEVLVTMAAEVADLKRDDAELIRLRNESETLRVKQNAAARVALPTPDLSGVYDIRELDQIPNAQSRVPPKFPTEMRQAGQSGEVLVEFIVDANGATQNVAAVRSTNPAFEPAAIEAIRSWTFRPGMKNQVPVNAKMQVPIVFTREEPGKKTEPPATWF